ncbi:hypothetical protein [Streptomyces sp. NBC_01296]|nr:hypothetical protein OG299_42465 [Streptomyces sp. NBC_01296]
MKRYLLSIGKAIRSLDWAGISEAVLRLVLKVVLSEAFHALLDMLS